MADSVKFLLGENDIPRQWYNVNADLPSPLAPPLHPGTGPSALSLSQRRICWSE